MIKTKNNKNNMVNVGNRSKTLSLSPCVKLKAKNGVLTIVLMEKKISFLERLIYGLKYIFQLKKTDDNFTKLHEFKIAPKDYDNLIKIILATKLKKI